MTAQAGGTTSSSLLRAKQQLRRELRAHRKTISPSQRRNAAQRAARALARACRRWQARHVALYLGLPEELDTAPLIAALRAAGCRLYVPVVAGRRMRFAPLAPPLRRNRYGIREPVALRRPPRLDLIVLPLVAFDLAGHRLGMGGGYYDRWLAARSRNKLPRRVGYAFASQQVTRVPTDELDVKLHAVATEFGLRIFPSPRLRGEGQGEAR